MPISLRYRRGSFLQELECGSIAEAIARAGTMRDEGTGFEFTILENGRMIAGDLDIRGSTRMTKSAG